MGVNSRRHHRATAREAPPGADQKFLAPSSRTFRRRSVKDPLTRKSSSSTRLREQFVGMRRENLIGRTAHELFPSPEAELMIKYDNEATEFNERLISPEFLLQTPANGSRLVTTTSLIVRDDANRPEYLITVIDDITERKGAEEKIAFMAHHDPLTGLVNRARFADRLDHLLTLVGDGTKLVVLFLDLDHFKYVNDTLGHLVGDDLLKAVADRLRGCVEETDTVARLGGDEFAIIHLEAAGAESASRLADRICTVIREPYDLGGLQASVDVSIGIS